MPEKSWRENSFSETAGNNLSELISPAFQKLINNAEFPEHAAALKRQVYFSKEELSFTENESADPLGEDRYCVEPFLVHQYENRVLLLSTGRCFSHCRYCFRRGFTARRAPFLNSSEICRTISYLKRHPEIREILVSGGDPLTAPIEDLALLLTELRSISPQLIIRLCTRAISFAPEVFDKAHLALLKAVKPVWIIVHINHFAELGEEQRSVISNILECGIPMQSQTVLLNAVNDKSDILVKLFHTLTCLGIKPGYLFQADLAYGTKRFRVPLKTALSLWETVKSELSGLSTPVFAVDLPGGGGKFPLSAFSFSNVFAYKGGNSFSAKGIDGNLYTYRT